MELQIVLETILNELCRLIGIVPLKAVNRVLCAVDPTNFVCGVQAHKANQHSTAELSTFQKCLLGNLLVVDSLLLSVFVHNCYLHKISMRGPPSHNRRCKFRESLVRMQRTRKLDIPNNQSRIALLIEPRGVRNVQISSVDTPAKVVTKKHTVEA